MNVTKNIIGSILIFLTFTGLPAHADEATDKLYKEAEFEHASGLDNSAFKKYLQLAEQGHANAQYRLGYMYYKGESRYGEGPSKNAKLATEWLHKSATQGHLLAQTYLGNIYFYGKGVPVDQKLGKFWYRKSAAQDKNQANSELYSAETIKQIDEEIRQTELSELAEAKSKGFDSFADLTLASKIKATPAELSTLNSLGVKTEIDYNKVIDRKKILNYAGENNSVTAIQFLVDEQEGKKNKLNPTAYRAKLNKHAADTLAKAEADKARAKADAERARIKAEANAEAAARAKAQAEDKAKATIAKPEKDVKLPHINVDTGIDFKAKVLAFEKIRNSTAIDNEVGDDNRWYQLIISQQVIVCSQLTDTPTESLENINKIFGVTKSEEIKIDGTLVEILITQGDGKLTSLYLGRARCKIMQKFTVDQASAKKDKAS